GSAHSADGWTPGTRTNCSSASASPNWRPPARKRSREGRPSASPWSGPPPRVPRSCCWTSRSAPWPPSPVRTHSGGWSERPPNSASPPSWSPTMWTRRWAWARGPPCSAPPDACRPSGRTRRTGPPTPTRRCGTSSWPRTGRPEPRAMSDENRGVLPHLDRRSLLRAGGALAVGAGALGGAAALGDLVSAAAAPRGVETEDLRIGYLPITDAAPLLVAHGDGLYEQQKLIVGHPVLFRSWSSLMEAFLTRQVDVIHLLMPSAIQLRHVV